MGVTVRQRMAAREPRLGWFDVAVGAGLGVLVMAPATHWRAALIPIDPWDYVEGALNFPHGAWNEVGLSRWGMLAPLMLAGRLWGNSEATYYAYPIAAAGLLAAVLYGLAARLVNRWTGVAGALLVCSASAVFVHLSRGYPDLIAVAFVGLAVLSLVLARDFRTGHGLPSESTRIVDLQQTQQTQQTQPALVGATVVGARGGWPAADAGSTSTATRPPPEGGPGTGGSPRNDGWMLLWVLVAGGSAAWAFEVRDLTMLAWPALALALWRVGRPLIVVPTFLVLPVAAAALDAYLSWRVYDDPLLKLNALVGNSIASSSVDADAVYLGHSRAWYMTVPFRILWERSGGPALMIAMVVGLVGGAFLVRRLAPIWTWAVSVLALLWLAGGALRPATPSLRLDIVRYNLAYAVPLALTAVCVVAILLLRASGVRRLAVAVAAALLALGSLIPSARFAASFEGLAPNGGNALREMDGFLSEQPGLSQTRIWSDWGTARLAEVYARGPFGGEHWEPRAFRSLNRLLREPAVPTERLPAGGDLVVVYSADDQTCYHCHQAMAQVQAAFGSFPRPGWQELFHSSTGNLVVYRLPDGYVWPSPTPADAARVQAN